MLDEALRALHEAIHAMVDAVGWMFGPRPPAPVDQVDVGGLESDRRRVEEDIRRAADRFVENHPL